MWKVMQFADKKREKIEHNVWKTILEVQEKNLKTTIINDLKSSMESMAAAQKYKQ